MSINPFNFVGAMKTIFHKQLFRGLVSLFFPRHCVVCGARLLGGEHILCVQCTFRLPYTDYRGKAGNPVERVFWGRLPIVKANAYMKYVSGSDSRRAVLRLKYFDRPDVGNYLGACMATDLLDTDFFTNIDMIIPIPLASKRQRKRGYNQSEELAKGIHRITSLPIDNKAVIRTVANPTQTHLDAAARRANVKDIFAVKVAENLRGKHILLVDDVLTTGATIISCGQAIVKVCPDVRFSVLTLSLAGHHASGVNLQKKK